MSCLWSVFDASAKRRGDATALDFGTLAVSFRDLHHLSLRAAALLTSLGVTRGDVVALQLPKRPLTYALMLGCLRLGAIYTPLDPNNPADRTTRMLARLKPAALFTTGTLRNTTGQTITMSGSQQWSADDASWPAAIDDATPSVTSALHPAYVMFTSGSTGEPKGAVIPQMGIVSLMRWAADLIGPSDEQRFTALNPLHFDNSVFDFYCGLVAGGTLVPIETSETPHPIEWSRRIAAGRASVVFCVPTLLMLLEQSGALELSQLPDVRMFLFGGEGYPIERLRRLHGTFSKQARLINVYGPTETSCICSSLEVTADVLARTASSFVSLGRMHVGFVHAVLNDELQPVATGAVGELWIGGGNVGLGYYGNAEETARRFQQDPQQSAYRSIYYRSGDLVREDEFGALWFHGRKDNQIKIAGHRVELEEIDLAAEAVPGVRRSLTVLVNRAAAPELVTAFEADRRIAPADLAAQLKDRLPVYMRPTRLLQLEALPTNANGKVDRLAVQRRAEAAVTQPASPPSGGTEAAVRRAWVNALGHDGFSGGDSFFDLGGTSLALTRVHAELSAQFPGSLSVTDLFEHPTVARIVAYLDGGGTSAESSKDAVVTRGQRQQAMLARLRERGAGSRS